MSKITDKDRVEIFYKRKQGQTYPSLVKEYGIAEPEIRYLVKLIERYGPTILAHSRKKHYSKEQKQQMIDEVLVAGRSLRDVSLEYGMVTPSILGNWIKSYKENGCAILERKKGRPSMKKKTTPEKSYEEMTDAEKIAYLEKKNKYLEAENDYLKKLHAVVQERKAQQQKKK